MKSPIYSQRRELGMTRINHKAKWIARRNCGGENKTHMLVLSWLFWSEKHVILQSVAGYAVCCLSASFSVVRVLGEMSEIVEYDTTQNSCL